MAALQRGTRCLGRLEDRLLGDQAGSSHRGRPGEGRPEEGSLVEGRVVEGSQNNCGGRGLIFTTNK